jgi:hypothetical protein
MVAAVSGRRSAGLWRTITRACPPIGGRGWNRLADRRRATQWSESLTEVASLRTIVIAADIALGHELAAAVRRDPRLGLAGASSIGPGGLLLARSSAARAAVVALGLRDSCDPTFVTDLFDIGVEHVLVVSRALDAALEHTALSTGARWLSRASAGPAEICESLAAAA